MSLDLLTRKLQDRVNFLEKENTRLNQIVDTKKEKIFSEFNKIHRENMDLRQKISMVHDFTKLESEQ